MSKELSSVQRTEFDTQTKLAYQGGSKLRDTVRYEGDITGDTFKFNLMGKGQGHERAGSSSLVVPMDLTHEFKTATLKDYEHPEYTDIFDQAGANFNEKMYIAESIGKAMGRTEDQVIIDQLIAGTYNTTDTDGQGKEIAAGGTGFTTAKLRELRAYYDDLEVEEEDTYILISGTGLNRLLANTETADADFNTVRTLVNGQMNTFMGFNFITIGARRLEGGLGGSGLVAYSYCKQSVGLASASIEKSMSVDWIPERVSYLCNGMLKTGSTIIDPEGTAKISFT